MITNNNYVDRCHGDVLSFSTFSCLNRGELAACCSVSTRWRALASQDKAWKSVAKQLFGHALNVPNYRAFLRECASQRLNSNDEIVDHLQAFVNRIKIGQNARFRCFIRSRKVQVLEVVIKARQDRLPYNVDYARYNVANLDFTEDYTATRELSGNLQSLVTPPPPPYQAHSMSIGTSWGWNTLIVRVPEDGNFMGIASLPFETGPDTPMHARIQYIIGRRLTQLDMPRNRRLGLIKIVFFMSVNFFFIFHAILSKHQER